MIIGRLWTEDIKRHLGFQILAYQVSEYIRGLLGTGIGLRERTKFSRKLASIRGALGTDSDGNKDRRGTKFSQAIKYQGVSETESLIRARNRDKNLFPSALTSIRNRSNDKEADKTLF